MTTVRMLLSIAAAQGQPVEQMDFSNAYLNAEIGDSQEPIFMHQPPGYEEYDGDGRLLAALLRMNLYGLRQGGILWYRKLKRKMLKLGFHVSHADPCLFCQDRPARDTHCRDLRRDRRHPLHWTQVHARRTESPNSGKVQGHTQGDGRSIRWCRDTPRLGPRHNFSIPTALRGGDAGTIRHD